MSETILYRVCRQPVIIDNKKIPSLSSYLTPFIRRIESALFQARETREKMQTTKKYFVDHRKRPAPNYDVEDLLSLKT